MASPPPKRPSRQKLLTRACDPCKVRKIKCSEVSPCRGCVAAGIECTFNKTQATRGPKRLRAKTVAKIARSQGKEEPQQQTEVQGGSSSSPSSTDEATSITVGLSHESSQLRQLLGILGVYATRLSPIWPIVDADHLASLLVSGPGNESARHLASAVALATVAQLRLTSDWKHDVKEITHRDDDEEDLFDGLRISFFLHIYYENATPGGAKSLLYLREAITKAELLGMDREVTYASLDEQRGNQWRRVLWLLFVTERGVAILHRLSVILKPNLELPWLLPPTNDQILPAFLNLVHLFWVFDQSGIFIILQRSRSDITQHVANNCLDVLRQTLRENDTFDDVTAQAPVNNPVQKADLIVTRHWMRVVLWKAAQSFGVVITENQPIVVAQELLSSLTCVPRVALESQGPTLEFKIFEIATSVLEALASDSSNQMILYHPGTVLKQLQSILLSSRGGNKKLADILDQRAAALIPDNRILQGLSLSLHHQTGRDEVWQRSRSPSPMTRFLLENPTAWTSSLFNDVAEASSNSLWTGHRTYNTIE